MKKLLIPLLVLAAFSAHAKDRVITFACPHHVNDVESDIKIEELNADKLTLSLNGDTYRFKEMKDDGVTLFVNKLGDVVSVAKGVNLVGLKLDDSKGRLMLIENCLRIEK